MAAATNVVDPRSSDAGFGHRCRLGGQHEARKDRGRADPGHHQTAILADVYHRTRWRHPASTGDGRFTVPTCGQPGGFTCRVDATNLHAHRAEAADAQHQNRHQRRERERCLDGDRTPVI
ncbi:hypothetical protein ACT17_08190 [Mycolicibacterium conceptionense]|uniref:Uncharacterized protein n=1 Tax=Mycolicibacterium conceptionense TaxID=451644 RepID=A0A0J8UD19_9MYCO|nr:hypothetical protein ACT17_08190 [Mycolicibacterium conceptionense]